MSQDIHNRLEHSPRPIQIKASLGDVVLHKSAPALKPAERRKSPKNPKRSPRLADGMKPSRSKDAPVIRALAKAT